MAYSNDSKVRSRAGALWNRHGSCLAYAHVLACLLACASLLLAGGCTGDATRIREATFELTLPGRWAGGFDENSSAWVYLTRSGEEGITVNTLRRGPDPDGSKLQADLDALLSVSLNREQQLSDEPVVLTQPKTSRTRGQLTAVFDTFGSSSQRRKRTLLVVNQVAAGSFSYEAFGLTREQFSTRADAVLRTARLAQ